MGFPPALYPWSDNFLLCRVPWRRESLAKVLLMVPLMVASGLFQPERPDRDSTAERLAASQGIGNAE